MKHAKIFYVLIIAICIILSTILIGVLSIFTTLKITTQNARTILNLECKNACQEFDSTLKSIEQSVNTLTQNALFNLDDFQRFKTDAAYVDNYTETLRHYALDTLNNTQGALSIYIRYNPELVSSTSGMYYVLDKEKQQYVDVPVTDLNNCTYEESTWYHIPVKNGHATWMEPYDNTDIGYRMISYIVPYYIGEELIGVVGMDIDFDYITELINSIQIYDTGYGFLINPKGQAIVVKDFNLYDDLTAVSSLSDYFDSLEKETSTGQYEYSNKRRAASSMYTQNNMILTLTTPNEEIYKDSYILIRNIGYITLASLTIIFILAAFIIRKLFRLAEIDELTGIYNRKYFIDAYHNFDAKKLKKYSLFIFDIDKFKNVNDTYGHNKGDLAIRYVAQLAKNTLDHHSIVARWGGDEFIGLIKTDIAQNQLEELRQKIEEKDSTDYGKITISIGISNIRHYKNFRETLEAADSALYSSKANGRNHVTYQNAK